jgi:diadenylate cyclase
MMLMSFIDISFIDVLDIVLVAIILYQLYILTRGTPAIKIFVGILAIYLLWKLVTALQMEMLGEILGQFIGVGVIALIIVFQKELRQFLLFIGNREVLGRTGWFSRFYKSNTDNELWPVDEIIKAVQRMTTSKTGAIILMQRKTDLEQVISSEKRLDALLSAPLLESVFYKNAPLHDGAVLIVGNRIICARGVVPVSESDDFPGELGMRHRAALGVAERTDALVIIVSEQTGYLSIAEAGAIHMELTIEELRTILSKG